MLVNCYGKGRFKNLNEVLVKYYVNGQNMSTSESVINTEKKERIQITKKFLRKVGIKIPDKYVFKYLLCNFNKYNQKKEN